MLAWMTSFGALKRIGVECTGTYGSGLLRYLQNAGLEVLEVTAPDRMERRKRGKSDTIDAECAAHAAFLPVKTDIRKNSARRRPVTGQSPRTGEEAQCICSYSEQVHPEAISFSGMIYPHIQRPDPVNRSMNDQ